MFIIVIIRLLLLLHYCSSNDIWITTWNSSLWGIWTPSRNQDTCGSGCPATIASNWVGLPSATSMPVIGCEKLGGSMTLRGCGDTWGRLTSATSQSWGVTLMCHKITQIDSNVSFQSRSHQQEFAKGRIHISSVKLSSLLMWSEWSKWLVHMDAVLLWLYMIVIGIITGLLNCNKIYATAMLQIWIIVSQSPPLYGYKIKIPFIIQNTIIIITAPYTWECIDKKILKTWVEPQNINSYTNNRTSGMTYVWQWGVQYRWLRPTGSSRYTCRCPHPPGTLLWWWGGARPGLTASGSTWMAWPSDCCSTTAPQDLARRQTVKWKFIQHTRHL